ncbi:Ferredoxin [Plesiocystis pacifica SIR-1]|uniref:Ferredoxin n=1 Tax=Plesiocystis pacifica SIR-1 TaxID=391625 RepID=A6GB30_9BACT|nr:ferredoxin--NADP reductase [Plesiocystis pacifica]EDM76912.1 Ferredoxin [Plesiocystis pacifica SIR-1]
MDLLPRVLRPRAEQLSRDVEMVLAGLRGERAPPWLARDGARYGAPLVPNPQRSHDARALAQILAVEIEASDAVSLILRWPEAFPAPRPGQFITLELPEVDEGLRRTYSISSDCRAPERVSITVRRVANGRASTWLNREARAGMELRVTRPAGRFGEALETSEGAVVMVAGGSGITPLMAMLRSGLGDPGSPRAVTLIYANRSAESTIFGAELRAMAAAPESALRLIEVLEPSHGRLDAACFASLVDRHAALAEALGQRSTQVLVCGPPPMMGGVVEQLRGRGVDDEQIHLEHFTAGRTRAEPNPERGRAWSVEFVEGPDGPATTVVVQPGQSLLDAGLDANINLPYSCAMGGCGACMSTLEEGSVAMDEPNCLRPRERAEGRVLTCVGRPTSPCRLRITTGS